MHITDATSISDHLDKATREEFYLAKDIPLPHEIDEPLDALLNKPSDLARHWGSQLDRLETLTKECQGIQRIWDAMTPNR